MPTHTTTFHTGDEDLNTRVNHLLSVIQRMDRELYRTGENYCRRTRRNLQIEMGKGMSNIGAYFTQRGFLRKDE